jgi:hypothetical protein
MIDKVSLDLNVQDESINFLGLFNNSVIDSKEELIPNPALSYGKDIFGNPIEIVSYGNFLALVGASKSMKSFLRTALEACYMGGESQKYFPNFLPHDRGNKYCLAFDTEQGRRHVVNTTRRVEKMMGSTNPFYKSFCLRPYSPKERLQFIEWVYYESDLKGKIGLGSIDGIADLVDDVNDLKQSNEVVQFLMKLTEETNSALITVIHKNFDSLKPTGHLGSAVTKKAETVLFVDREDFNVNVRSQYARNIPIEEFSFRVDDQGIPELMDF